MNIDILGHYEAVHRHHHHHHDWVGPVGLAIKLLLHARKPSLDQWWPTVVAPWEFNLFLIIIIITATTNIIIIVFFIIINIAIFIKLTRLNLKLCHFQNSD